MGSGECCCCALVRVEVCLCRSCSCSCLDLDSCLKDSMDLRERVDVGGIKCLLLASRCAWRCWARAVVVVKTGGELDDKLISGCGCGC